MRARFAPLPPARRRRIDKLIHVLPLVALMAQALLVAPTAQAGAVYPNPPNATPVAWPSSFSSYTTDTGAPISDVEGEAGVGSLYDIRAAGGRSAAVFLAPAGQAPF